MSETAASPPSAEAAIVKMVGESFSGAASAALPSSELEQEVSKFEFDAEFQTKIALHVARDISFIRKVGHLIKPNYFENVGEAAIVNAVLRFFKQYGTLPNRVAMVQLVKDDRTNKVIREDIYPSVKDAFGQLYVKEPDIGNGDYFAQNVAQFAQYQAVTNAIYKSVGLVEQKKMSNVLDEIKAAVAVGMNVDGAGYDYWNMIEERTKTRQDKLAGVLPPTGISTGNRELDNLLYHKGWGRKEIAAIMGGPKSGKTTALINFAKSASINGKNVLYVTLEVAAAIISERLDACITDTLMRDLETKIHDVRAKILALQARSGALKVHEYPSNSFTPAQLEALIERYKSPGLNSDGTIRPAIIFDLVVVDYADIMSPNFRQDEARENSKTIWLDLRSIAFKEDLAMLTATATNREGIKATVATLDTVADDINKARTVDLMISINITEEERAAGEARLYFAASRNQESGFTVFIKQEIAKMVFISKILRVE
jgi:replicative DNA helicase